MHNTPRLGLHVVDGGTDNVSAYPAVNAQAMGVLDDAAIFLEGTLASRPAANSVDYGTFYKPNDVPGVLYVSDGTNWQAESLVLSGLFSALPGAGVLGRRYYATDSKQWFADNGSIWVALTSYQEGVASARPSMPAIGPGLFYYATDTGKVSVNTTAGWVILN